MFKIPRFSSNHARKKKCGSLDGAEDVEYNGTGFAEISEIYVMQEKFLYGMSFDRICIHLKN